MIYFGGTQRAGEAPDSQQARKPRARSFQTKSFSRLAKKEGIGQVELCRALSELEEGKGDDLGGNVWKKRLNENRSRALVATKPGAFWIFMFVFAKQDQENIGPAEAVAFRKLAADYGKAGMAGIEMLVAAGVMMEICNESEKQSD